MHTVNLLTRLVENHQILVYLIIFFALVFEGEFTLIFTGILIHLGALSFVIAIPIIIVSTLLKTFLGYELGGFLFEKFNHHNFFKYIQKRVYSVLPRFKEKPFWSIFISKFIIGANNIVIIFSGYEKIDYKKYLKAELSATIVWVPLLLFLGYIFSYTALQVSRDLWRFSMTILVLFILFILFDKLISWLYELFEEFYDKSR